ncbi:MAG TPA: chromate efflux transporter [Myxococcota bacterium]|nr:chromate efflux transporter [Myxococcota bacterium]
MSASAIPFAEAVRVWTRVALQSFGGPAGQIAVMHRILVEEKRWIGEERFLHALSYCMLLPGPEAQQLATYIGWLLHRTAGGLVAGGLFVLPGFLAILSLSLCYVAWADLPVVAGLFFGIKPAVLALVVEALLRIARRAGGGAAKWAIAGAAFVGLFFFAVPFPWIVLGAALAGVAGARLAPQAFRGPAPAVQGGALPVADALIESHALPHTIPSARRSLRVAIVCGALWLAPVAALALARGPHDVFTQIAFFFSKLAVVTFGGAYAVLAYMAQQAVSVYGWLTPREMLDGLGMAETTPGPLIQVVQFVGFLGAYRSAGSLPPWLAGTLAAVLTTWVTYVPCFLWIFAGAPYVERLRENRWLRGALTGITAAVVGVIFNLTVWFSLHTLFARVEQHGLGPLSLELPVWASLDPAAAAIAAGALVATFAFHVRMLPLLAGSAAAGLAWRLLTA